MKKLRMIAENAAFGVVLALAFTAEAIVNMVCK